MGTTESATVRMEGFSADVARQRLDEAIGLAMKHREFLMHPDTDFTRDRKLPLVRMLKTILSMQGGSIARELFDADHNLDVTSSAFVQQRDKIRSIMGKQLFEDFNRLCTDCDTRTYRGYRLYAVDGSDVNIAKNPDSESYIANGDREGYNQLHVNAIYDVMNRLYIECFIQPKSKVNEIEACLQMLHRIAFQQPTILLADRGYGSNNLMEAVRRIPNLDYLFRVKNGWIKEFYDFKMEEFDKDVSFIISTSQTELDKQLYAQGLAKYMSGKSKYGKDKKDVQWQFESPFCVKLRVVRFKITEDTYETIVTSLNRFQFPPEEIKKLYHKRWGIETSFRDLKYALGMVNFHAKKEEAICMEIYAHMTMYNFCERIIMNVVIRQDEGRKHTYQVDFAQAFHICRSFYRARADAVKWCVEAKIAKYILPVRPDRQDKRKLKPKAVVYFLYRVA